jgi:hypothetical protein
MWFGSSNPFKYGMYVQTFCVNRTTCALNIALSDADARTDFYAFTFETLLPPPLSFSLSLSIYIYIYIFSFLTESDVASDNIA